jgi:hypothetical protein
MNKELTYEERVRWFVNNYYETGMEYASMLESMKNKDLDNFVWYGKKIQIPKFYNDKNFFINGFRAGYYRATPDEISDEEIEKAAQEIYPVKEQGTITRFDLDQYNRQIGFVAGIMWYKKQLKNK